MTSRVRLSRRVTFSAGHRYWLADLTEAENRELFGKWASPYNHGHNYVLEVSAEGTCDPKTGMVVNIKDIDDVLQNEIVSQFDGKSINDEVLHFTTVPSTLENLLMYVRDALSSLPSQVDLVRLKLEEMPTLWAELELKQHGNNGSKTHELMTLTRSYEFAASHRLYNPNLSDEQNFALFGKCSNPSGHGHNYLLEVTVQGQPDAQTGMMVDLEELDKRINSLVIDRYDHKNLNVDLKEFVGQITTSERVAQEIFRALDGNLPAKLKRIRLLETARNIFEVEAP